MTQVPLLGRRRECVALDQLVENVRAGHGSALVVRGAAGVGKTALLAYVDEHATGCRVVRVTGLESETELAFAGLHQLCAPLLEHLDELAEPQRAALATAFGLRAGAVPDRFVVSLAALNLLAVAAAERPLVCLVDDAQWLDRTSAQVLGFVARRLRAESVAVVFGLREPAAVLELADLPDLVVDGLADADARRLLRAAVAGPLDARVRDRIVAETRGNPLALVELAGGVSGHELAGGFATPGAPPSLSIEESFRRRLAALPEDARRLLLLAAAEPLGEPVLLWRAAERLGIPGDVAAHATEAGLCEFGARVRFRHPVVRAVAYRTGTPEQRRRAHGALAAVTDGRADPDRRAWHMAQAATGPDAAVAGALERSAARAGLRAGQPSEAAFLERAAELTLDAPRRAERALAAAEAKHLAGFAEPALRLAAVAARGPLGERDRLRLEALRGRVAAQQRGGDASRPLLRAAVGLSRIDGRLAREAFRDAFVAARPSGAPGLAEVAAAVRSAPPASDPPSVTDDLLDAAALLVDAGYPTGAPAARRALAAFRATSMPADVELRWLGLACLVAMAVWDDEAFDALSARQLEMARDAGVHALLAEAGVARTGLQVLAGDLAAAGEMLTQAARGERGWPSTRRWATAVLGNGSGRYDDALAAAEEAVADPAQLGQAGWALSELVEAAARCGRPEVASAAHARLETMARGCGTDWVLGLEARARALLAGRGAAEAPYRAAIEHLGRTRLRAELARAHLVYGEWLRREGRRVDAREQLRTAHGLLEAMGAECFAERALRELVATGERVRSRTVESVDELTAQEAEIARLAASGLTNPEIGGRLFLSPRTVEWHLRKVFLKLGISSRNQLRDALPDPEPLATPA